MNKWRFSAEVTIYVLEEKKRSIYVASAEKKSYQVAVTKLIDTEYRAINAVDLKFSAMKLVKDENESKSFRVEVKSDSLPEPNEWWILKNFNADTIIDIITQVEGVKGEFSKEFEVAFNTSAPHLVTLMTSEMESYKGCLSELSRRLSCDLGTKSKKWIVGHKYETEAQTYIYLGDYSCRKISNTNSGFLSDITMTTVKLYVSELKDGETCVSDVLNGRCFDSVSEDSIKILYAKSKMAVDTGEVLKNDIQDKTWEDFVPGIFKRTCDRFKFTTTFGRETYQNIKDQLDIFSIQSEDTFDYPENHTALVENLIKDWGWEVLIRNWERSVVSLKSMSPKESNDTNIESLGFFIAFSIRDENIDSTNYYDGLFKRLGVDLKKICSDLLDDWEVELGGIKTDFDVYTKNLDYIVMSKNPELYINLKTYSSYCRPNDKSKTVSEFLEENSKELAEVIKLLANYSKNNFGAGVDDYKVVNVGTIRNPRSFVKLKMSLKNILDFANSEMKLTDNLKNEIMLNNITSVNIEADTEAEIL